MASKEELLEFSQKFREELRTEAQAMMAARYATDDRGAVCFV